MQNKKPDRNVDEAATGTRADDDEINARLVDILKANTVRAERTVPSDDRIASRGMIRESYALLRLVGLMVVAYFYTLLVGKRA